MKRRLIFVFLLVLHSKTIFCQGCFFPDTSTDTRGKRCFEPQEGKAAGCCFDDHYCLDNGLCLEPRAFTIYRASCTDRTFRADGCPTVCLKQSEDAHRGVNWCPMEKIWTCEDAGICNKTSISMESPVQIIMNATAMADPNGVSKSVGISTRAVVGVGAGIGIPLLISVAVLATLLVRERKKSKAALLSQPILMPNQASSKPANLFASPDRSHYQLHRVDGERTTELATDTTVRHELPH